MARNASQRADKERAQYIAEMNAYFKDIDSFQLAEEEEDAAKAGDAPVCVPPSTKPRASYRTSLQPLAEHGGEHDALHTGGLAAVPVSPAGSVASSASSVYQEALSTPQSTPHGGVVGDEDAANEKKFADGSAENQAHQTPLGAGIYTPWW